MVLGRYVVFGYLDPQGIFWSLGKCLCSVRCIDGRRQCDWHRTSSLSAMSFFWTSKFSCACELCLGLSVKLRAYKNDARGPRYIMVSYARLQSCELGNRQHGFAESLVRPGVVRITCPLQAQSLTRGTSKHSCHLFRFDMCLGMFAHGVSASNSACQRIDLCCLCVVQLSFCSSSVFSSDPALQCTLVISGCWHPPLDSCLRDSDVISEKHVHGGSGKISHT